MKTLCILLLLLITSASSLHSQNTDTLFYSVVKGVDKAGYLMTWQSGANQYNSSYKFNDRGRGDSVIAAITTDGSGLVIKAETRGVDYYKTPFHEAFSIEKDSAIITVNGERKSKLFKQELFQSAEPTDIEPVTQYMLKHANTKISLVDGGTVMMLSPHPKTVSFKGKPLNLFLCEFYSNDNNPPSFIWLSEDKHVFASVNDWFSTIRRGYESLCDTLNILQLIQSKDYFRKQMKSLTDTLPSRLAINHVRVFDSENAVMLNDMTVIVNNGKIISLGKTSAIKIPKGYKTVDGKNKTLVPGLWDMHAHYQKEEGLNYLAGGVTHVRDMGNSNRLPTIRDAIRDNELMGPDISYMSGFIDQAGPFQGPTGAIVHSLDEGLKAVDDYSKRGYQQIKLYSSIDPKWVAPLATEAHRLGMKVCGHIPSFMTATQAINAGYNEVTHMNMIMLNFQGDTIDTRSMGRFKVVGERGKNLDLNSDEVKSFISLMQEKNVSLDPTMNVFAGMLTVFPGDTDASIKPIINWMPGDQRQNLAAQSSFAPVAQKATYDASFEKMMQMLKKLYDNKILIVAGTDGGEAFALEHELELYVQAGIPPMNAMQCATYNAARDCNVLNQYGTITEGRPADLILIDGNPATNISEIRRVEWVIKNNRMYYPKKLYASIGWSYFY